MSSDLNHSLEPVFIQLTTTAASGEERKLNMMDMQLVQTEDGSNTKRGGSWETKGCKRTRGGRTWYGKLEAVGQELYSKFNEIIQKKKNIRENKNKTASL